jgi:hypothetical protein
VRPPASTRSCATSGRRRRASRRQHHRRARPGERASRKRRLRDRLPRQRRRGHRRGAVRPAHPRPPPRARRRHAASCGERLIKERPADRQKARRQRPWGAAAALNRLRFQAMRSGRGYAVERSSPTHRGDAAGFGGLFAVRAEPLPRWPGRDGPSVRRGRQRSGSRASRRRGAGSQRRSGRRSSTTRRPYGSRAGVRGSPTSTPIF